MDTQRLTTGELIAGVGAAALLILMFLPWYGVDVNVAGFSASESGNAWETLEFIDILLFLLAVITLGVVGARMTGSNRAHRSGSSKTSPGVPPSSFRRSRMSASDNWW